MKNNLNIYYKAKLIIFFNLLICSLSNAQQVLPDKVLTSITVRGNKFVDIHGREILLNGINVGSKSKKENYIFPGDHQLYAKLKSWGFNCIRFIIIWDGLEPQPGVYNDAYLKEIDKRIQWASESGIYVVLDMHQDLYGVKFSDGAPDWATLDEGEPHITGDIWSDAYLLSPAVQKSFDNFWTNTKARDGIGLQDHYAALWKHIAKRYAGNNAIIGYDLMNEPFPGSSAKDVGTAWLTAYAKMVFSTTGKTMSNDELAAILTKDEKKKEALRLVSSKSNYQQVVDALEPFSKQFEENILQQFYQKVSVAIRSVDTSHIIFLEHSYLGNAGVPSNIKRTTLTNGEPDYKEAYAGHGYDVVTDTKEVGNASLERVEFIYDRIKRKGEQLNMPVWMGEWGAYYGDGNGIISTARAALEFIGKNKFGNAYWSYYKGLEESDYFTKALLRPYPVFISGELDSYHYDYNSAVLKISWKEDKKCKSPLLVYIPQMSKLKANEIKLLKAKKIIIKDSEAGWIQIPLSAKEQFRTINIDLK